MLKKRRVASFKLLWVVFRRGGGVAQPAVAFVLTDIGYQAGGEGILAARVRVQGSNHPELGMHVNRDSITWWCQHANKLTETPSSGGV